MSATPDPLLFGHDPTERIVAVHPLAPAGNDGAGETMRVYSRLASDEVVAEDADFYPLFFLADTALLKGFPRDGVLAQELRGAGTFGTAVAFRSRRAYWNALRHIEALAPAGTRTRDIVYSPGGPEQQYLMQSGRTLFKGMVLDDLHRMQLDIEVYASTGAFPSASRAGDRIIIVALSDNRGWSEAVHVGDGDEAALLADTVRLIRQRDPDVIEGHNVYAFDFPYLMARCARHGVPFAIGRDGSVPRVFPSSIRFAERSIDYPALDIAGRHVIDTYFQVMSYDVVRRDLPAYGLKAAARYFGFASGDRTYVEGADIPRLWREDRERLLAYALDDVQETALLARHLSGSTFYLTQMVPMPYGQAARTGPAAKIEALFVREYLRRRQALPAPAAGSQSAGGYTDVFVTGVVGPIVYADVESLYPSIMLAYDIRPAGDGLGLFPLLLRQLTDLRLSTKRAAAASGDPDARQELDARQAAFKIVINTFYGSLGFSAFLFNDYAEADRVTRIGRELLRQIIDLIRQRGGTPVEVDTDGILFVPPAGVEGENQERAFVAAVSEALPEGINLAFDGRYRAMLSYKKKNYALETYDGRLIFKGSSLVSRSSERFGRHFVREVVALLMKGDLQAAHDLYLQTREAIIRHEWTDGVRSFQRTETLKESAETYAADTAAGRRPRSAAYELALERQRGTGKPLAKGDRISFYVAGAGAGAAAHEQARLASEWDPAAPDENTAYYLRRLDEVAAKFEAFFETSADFRLVFSEEDMFGFDASGVRLAVKQVETG